MKYAFIYRNKGVWPISVQCRVLRVSVAGYHEHFVRRRKLVPRRHLPGAASRSAVVGLFGQLQHALLNGD